MSGLCLSLPACGGGGDDTQPPHDGTPDGGGMDGTTPDAPPVVNETCDPGEIQACTPSAGTPGADGVIFRGTLVLPDSLICSGDVLYSRASGNIVCVGPDCSTDPGATGAPVICADVVSPGLINAHTHSNYGHLPPWDHTGRLFTDKEDWQGDSDYKTFIHASGSPNGIRTSMSCEVGKWDEAREMIGGASSLVGSQGGTTNQTCLTGLMRDLDLDGAVGSPGTELEFAL